MAGAKRMRDFVEDDDAVDGDADFKDEDDEEDDEEEDVSEEESDDGSDADEKPAKSKKTAAKSTKRAKADKPAKASKKQASRPSSSSTATESDTEGELKAEDLPTRQVESDGAITFALSAKRKVSISKFRGKVYVGIREYYLADDGQIKPGSKGVSLPVSEFKSLKDLAPSIVQEIPRVTQKTTEEVTLEITPKRKVSVREYKGTVYVDIREYYLNDEGKIAPGRKGISLDLKQFQVLRSLLPVLDDEIKKL